MIEPQEGGWDFPEVLRNIEPFAAELLFKWRMGRRRGPLPPSPLPSPIPATFDLLLRAFDVAPHPEGPAASRYIHCDADREETVALSVDLRKCSITALRDAVLICWGLHERPQGLDSVRKPVEHPEIAWRRWKRAKEHIELGGGVKLHDARVYLAGDPRDKQHEMIRGLEKALADGKLVDGCHVSLVAAYRTMIEALGHGVGENKIPKGLGEDAFAKNRPVRDWLKAHKIYP